MMPGRRTRKQLLIVAMLITFVTLIFTMLLGSSAAGGRGAGRPTERMLPGLEERDPAPAEMAGTPGGGAQRGETNARGQARTGGG
ncbi:MAG TPA: hypothetical protein VFJ30_06005 [Phycisphaerae bacterium]|nr:hypothetical protein [Phycisphaerae bacterium]